MKILIKNATIVDLNGPFNGQVKSILVENGKIRFADPSVSADQIIEGKKLCVSIGWFDMRVTMGEPGLEHKEDIDSVSAAAAAGGFTAIASMPNTKPPVQTKDAVSYLRNRTGGSLVEIYPIASVTLGNKGEELTEMIDLHTAGAVAFSDGDKPVWHTDVMLKALQYTQTFEGLVINHAEDKLLTHGAQMNESLVSTRLGLRGFPKLAEELMVARDLQILEYTGGRLHFAHVSSPGSLDLIRTAKKKGLQVTCEIAVYQLVLNEELLTSFDTNYKVNPPLRAQQDIEAYWKAIADDTIDVIVSDHIPQDVESKNLEYDLADFGMIGLETMFALLNTYNKNIPLEKLVAKFTQVPRDLLKIEKPSLNEGAIAELTVFDPEESWTYEEKNIQSKSKNSPFVGQTLKGKVKAVVKGKLVKVGS
ncbi:MAG TPA: dihydroorotase [Cytophagaceae bacterium]|nr:dihydroorotase [Cytophagaceae bacterium]